MARIRSLKPELWQDEAVGDLSRDARLLFVGLITQADDEGRLVGAGRLIWSQVYPWDDIDLGSFERWLEELAGAELVQRYESNDGRQYLHLIGWKQHQKISHPTPSRLPKPPSRRKRPREASRKAPEDAGKAPERNGTIPEGSSLIGGDRRGRDRSTPQTPQRGAVV